MSSNTSPNDATIKISAAADQLASLEVTAGQANAKSSDSTDADPELWKPPPPAEECPVCFVPLPLPADESSYWVCCGKMICAACMEETIRATNIINKKRAKKKQPPLEHACSFCRTLRVLTSSSFVSRFEERVRKGDAELRAT